MFNLDSVPQDPLDKARVVLEEFAILLLYTQGHRELAITELNAIFSRIEPITFGNCGDCIASGEHDLKFKACKKHSDDSKQDWTESTCDGTYIALAFYVKRRNRCTEYVQLF